MRVPSSTPGGILTEASWACRPGLRPGRSGRGFRSPCRAVAGRAGAFDHEKALLRAHLTMPPHMVQRRAPVPGSRPSRRRVAGSGQPRSRFRCVLPVEGFVERDFEIVAQVRAAPLLLTTAAATKGSLPKIVSKMSPRSEKPPPPPRGHRHHFRTRHDRNDHRRRASAGLSGNHRPRLIALNLASLRRSRGCDPGDIASRACDRRT
jgi:hypothetical protein